jgi:hypothetical protein
MYSTLRYVVSPAMYSTLRYVLCLLVTFATVVGCMLAASSSSSCYSVGSRDSQGDRACSSLVLGQAADVLYLE